MLDVFTGADIESVLKPIPCCWLVPNSNLKVATYPAIARDVVRYIGDAVAVVVADTPYQAHDALDLIDVDYEPLPAVVDPEKATKPGAPCSTPMRPTTSHFTGRSPAATWMRRSRTRRSSSGIGSSSSG